MDLLPCGVPQGSIGGPLLWLCFTYDQPDVVHEHPIDGQHHLRGCDGSGGPHGDRQGGIVEPGGDGDCGDMVGYVDDGAYSYAHADPTVLCEVLSRKYSLIEDWINGNKLVINPDKTHLMVMGPRKISEKRSRVIIQAGPHTISPTVSEKLLGANLHQSLKWNDHIMDNKNSIMNQLTSRINGLKKISRNSSFKTRLMVANGVFMSKVVYLIAVWGGAQQYLINALQVQQLTAARAVCGFSSKWWSKQKLLDRLGWLSIRQLIHYNTVLQAHKTITTGKPAPLYNSISTQHPYPTRNATFGHIRFGETFRGESSLSNASFRNRAVHWFNAVPVSV